MHQRSKAKCQIIKTVTGGDAKQVLPVACIPVAILGFQYGV